jgi:uncharacterized C2H2 Zn-finger protein
MNNLRCPHCGGFLKTKDIQKHLSSVLGKKSGEKRKGDSEQMRKLAQKRWEKVKKDKLNTK